MRDITLEFQNVKTGPREEFATKKKNVQTTQFLQQQTISTRCKKIHVGEKEEGRKSKPNQKPLCPADLYDHKGIFFVRLILFLKAIFMLSSVSYATTIFIGMLSSLGAIEL